MDSPAPWVGSPAICRKSKCGTPVADLDRYATTDCIVASVCGWRCVEENHHLHEDMKHEGIGYPSPNPSILSTLLLRSGRDTRSQLGELQFRVHILALDAKL